MTKWPEFDYTFIKINWGPAWAEPGCGKLGGIFKGIPYRSIWDEVSRDVLKLNFYVYNHLTKRVEIDKMDIILNNKLISKKYVLSNQRITCSNPSNDSYFIWLKF